MVRAPRDFKERLALLQAFARTVSPKPSNEPVNAELERFIRSVEEADQRFIESCSKAIATRLLDRGGGRIPA